MPDPYDTIHAALDLARHAPSSHNSQPWQVDIGPPDATLTRTVTFCLDEVTRLRALDTLDAEMAMSLGAFVGVACRAMTLAGLDWTCTALPDDIGVTLRVGRGTPPSPEALRRFGDLVHRRRTCRAPFRPDPLTAAQRLALQARGWPALGIGTAARVEVLTDRRHCREVARLVSHFGALDFSDFAAWSETYAHIRFCPAHRLREGRGFSIDSLLGPMSRLQRLGLQIALHPVSLQLLRPFGLPRRLAQGLAELTAAAPGVLVLTGPQSNPGVADLIETGARLSELWLGAAELGVQVHPLSVLLQHLEPRQALQDGLSLPGLPLFIARIGLQSPPEVRTPRIRLETILRQPEGAAGMPLTDSIGK